MRQPSQDRALYYRQVRDSLQTVVLSDLTSAQAIDTIGLINRILAEFIVEEEWAPTLSADFGVEFHALLHPDIPASVITVPEFDQLRNEAADVVAKAMAGDDQIERERCNRLVDVERRFLERVDQLRVQAMAEGAVVAHVGGADACSVTEKQVGAYLRANLPGSPDLSVDALTVVPGGRSKETIRVAVSGTSELPGEVILRKDRPVGLLNTRAADEFALIKLVHDFGGIPVPRPYLVGSEGDGLGDGTFLIMECVSGIKAGEFFPDLAAPSAHQDAIGRRLAESLARLHSIPLELLATIGMVPDTELSPASVSTMVEGMADRVASLSGPPNVTVPLAREWLLSHVDDVAPASRVCLLQSDFGFHNMLVDGDRVSALVDWESGSIGPPTRELASAFNPVTSLMPWPDFVQAYIDAGGPEEDTDPRSIAFYRVFVALGGFMTSRTGGDMFRSGTKRDLLTAHSGLDSQFRCARNLARALADAMAGDGIPSPRH
jgi:aminoglycoside phosphotransferase (APT) family kinase protein